MKQSALIINWSLNYMLDYRTVYFRYKVWQISFMANFLKLAPSHLTMLLLRMFHVATRQSSHRNQLLEFSRSLCNFVTALKFSLQKHYLFLLFKHYIFQPNWPSLVSVVQETAAPLSHNCTFHFFLFHTPGDPNTV
jgi:hypothetical protein